MYADSCGEQFIIDGAGGREPGPGVGATPEVIVIWCLGSGFRVRVDEFELRSGEYRPRTRGTEGRGPRRQRPVSAVCERQRGAVRPLSQDRGGLREVCR